MTEEYEHKKRMKYLAKYLGEAYYRIEELHNAISDAMKDYAQQQVSVKPEVVVSDDFDGHFQEIVAHIVIKNKEAHIDLINICDHHHRKKPNSMYIDFEQSLDSYKVDQNAR